MPNHVTRSVKTQRMYDNRVETTLCRYQQEMHGQTWADDPMAFAEWMLQQKARWKRSTWRMTRLAVQEYLQKTGAPLEAVQRFNDGHNPPGKAKGQFDANRVKGLPDHDLEKLLNLLTDTTVRTAHKIRGGTYDLMLAAFLRANILTGLRPSEWDTAEWANLNGEIVLQVKNRKTTNGRGNGTVRLLSLHPDTLPVIQAAFCERDRLYALGAEWPEIQSGMASRLKEIRHLVTKKTYTLYSTRHRFVSAAKQSGYGKSAIADMLGHASEETATLHYGRKIATTRGGKAPSEDASPLPLIGVTQGVGALQRHAPDEKDNGLNQRPFPAKSHQQPPDR